MIVKKISVALALLLSAPSLVAMKYGLPGMTCLNHKSLYVFQKIQDAGVPLTDLRKELHAKYWNEYEWLNRHAATHKVRANVMLDIIINTFHTKIVENIDTIADGLVEQYGRFSDGKELSSYKKEQVKNLVKTALVHDSYVNQHRDSLMKQFLASSEAYQQALENKK